MRSRRGDALPRRAISSLAVRRADANHRVAASIHQYLVPRGNLARLRRRTRRVLRILEFGTSGRNPGLVRQVRRISIAHVRVFPISHLALRSIRATANPWVRSKGRLTFDTSISEFKKGETVARHYHHGVEIGYVLQGRMVQFPGKAPTLAAAVAGSSPCAARPPLGTMERSRAAFCSSAGETR